MDAQGQWTRARADPCKGSGRFGSCSGWDCCVAVLSLHPYCSGNDLIATHTVTIPSFKSAAFHIAGVLPVG